MAATTTQPFTVTTPSPELQTRVRRTVGFRSECNCGFTGPVRNKRETAQWDTMVHRHRAHRP